MKAIIEKDKIVKFTIRDIPEAIEIGDVPEGSHIPDLRWTGTELLDLRNRTSFYVNVDTLEIHATNQPNTQLVYMDYEDKDNLIVIDGIVRVKTEDEKNEKTINSYKYRRRHDYPDLGDQIGAIMKYLKEKDDIPDELTQIISYIDDVKEKYEKPE